MNPALDELDDLPAAPAAATGAAVETMDVPDNMYEGVAKMGDVIPKGTYHFRLEKYNKQAYEDGPVYSLQWRCQQEPHTGRVVFSNCPWPTKVDIETANNPNAPDGVRREAQKNVSERLVVSKAIQEAAGIKPGTMPFEQFLGTNPECLIQISVGAKKELVKDPTTGADVLDKDGKKTFQDSGEMKNKVQRYLPMARPR